MEEWIPYVTIILGIITSYYYLKVRNIIKTIRELHECLGVILNAYDDDGQFDEEELKCIYKELNDVVNVSGIIKIIMTFKGR